MLSVDVQNFRRSSVDFRIASRTACNESQPGYVELFVVDTLEGFVRLSAERLISLNLFLMYTGAVFIAEEFNFEIKQNVFIRMTVFSST